MVLFGVYNPESLLIFLFLAGEAPTSVVLGASLIVSGLEEMRSSEGAVAGSGVGLVEVEDM